MALSDLTSNDFEATHYEVGDDGSLTVWADSIVAARFEAHQWAETRELGTKLSAEWPHPNIEYLVGRVLEVVILRFGGSVVGLHPDALSDWRLNDLEAFMSFVARCASLDPELREDRRELAEIRKVVIAEFGLDEQTP